MKLKLYYSLATAATAMIAPAIYADITADSTAKTNVTTSTTTTGNHYEINGGTQSGKNLYHSFSTFNVNTGESANFSGPATTNTPISNVIARVTGDNYSNIDGTVSCSIANANLWLINPHGILFGKNAKLDLTGSFYASTADYLKFANNEKFYVDTQSQNSVLSVENPIGFGFLQQNPVGIVVQQANLQVGSNKQLVLAGGPITLSGSTIDAPNSGRVDLIAAGSPGEVTLFATTPGTQISTPNVSLDPGMKRESINLIDTTITASGYSANEIHIVGGKFYMNAGSTIETTRLADVEGGAGTGIIEIKADESTVDGGTIHAVNSTNSSRQSDGIVIDSSKVAVRSDANADKKGQIISSANQFGAYADNIIITTSGTLEINRGEIGLSGTNGANVGDLTIKANNIAILNQGVVSSVAESDTELDNGRISIDTNGLYLSGDSAILSVTRDSNSQGIRINATDVGLYDRSSISTTASNTANGGNISLDSNNLVLRGGSSISATSTGSGKAGDVAVCGDKRVLLDRSSVLSTPGINGGGNIRVGSDGGVVMNESQIAANGKANVVVGACTDKPAGSSTATVIQNNSAIFSKGGTTDVQAAKILQSPGSVIDGKNASSVADTTALLAQPEPEKEEKKDKPANVRIAAFYTAAPVFQSPCATAVLKPRGSFIARDQWPLHGSPGDFLASSAPSAYLPSVALLSDEPNNVECGH